MKTLLGNHKQQDQLKKIVGAKSFSHAYLFCGPENIGKTEIAEKFAKTLLCEAPTKELEPCDICSNCNLIKAGNHPDLLFFDGKETISVDEIRDLIHFLELKPYQAKRKIALIAHAERLTEQASNSLLKTLEEPAKDTIIILTAEKAQNLLDTIISRSQVVNFNPIKESEISKLLEGLKLDDKEKELAVKISNGRPGVALELAVDADKRTKINQIIQKFEEIYFKGRIGQKLQFAAELSSEKENIIEIIDFLQVNFRQKLIHEEENRLMIVGLLDKLTETKDLIYKNINLLLVIEDLLLSGEK